MSEEQEPKKEGDTEEKPKNGPTLPLKFENKIVENAKSLEELLHPKRALSLFKTIPEKLDPKTAKKLSSLLEERQRASTESKNVDEKPHDSDSAHGAQETHDRKDSQ